MKSPFDACCLPPSWGESFDTSEPFVWETIQVAEDQVAEDQVVEDQVADVAVRYPVWSGDAAEQLLVALSEAGARLAGVPSSDVVIGIGRVADRFLDASDSLRREAIDLLRPTAG
ncbi:MAG TPA: hypothetical protein EYQ64_02655, partial [Gemmatimonadetes bacterium]|nr:hypothetical protein [Gemmatimonadota bacterium]